MKKLLALSALLLAALACDKTVDDGFVDQDNNTEQIITDRNLNVKFTTTSPGGDYSPSHILAVWLETQDGSFLRTLKVRAEKRMTHLYTWKSISSRNDNDAITGATITKHTSHDVDWNFLDANQDTVANGNYILKIELTDQNAQGPVASFNFSYNDSVISQQFDDLDNFKDIEITYSHAVE